MTSRTALGQRAEQLGEAFLVEQGYRIVARNFRVRGGEIDRVAWHQGFLCFVEIRSRRQLAWGTPEETVDRKKRGRLILAARHYLARHHPDPPFCRFDVLAVQGSEPSLDFQLFPDAFQL